MSKLIPRDVEEFLYTLGTFKEAVPGAFEEYAKTAATLLWEKYVMLEDASVQTSRFSVSSKRWQN